MQTRISKEVYDKIEKGRDIASLRPNDSLKICDEACILAKENNLFLEEGYALIGMSLASRAKSDISGMLNYSYKALAIFKDKNYIPGQAKALNLIGIAYFYNSMYEEALNCFREIIVMLEIDKDDLLLSKVYNNIGEIYREYEMYEQAMEYYNKAVEISIRNELVTNHAALLSNIGEVHFMNNQLELALEVYIKSYNIFIQGQDMLSLGEVENRIGMVYFAMKDNKNAKKYYNTAIKRLENINNKYYAIEVILNIANLYLEKKSSKVLDFYEKAMDFAKDIGSKKKISQIYKLISQFYELEGDYKNALEAYKSYFSFNEEVVSSNLSNRLEILNVEMDNYQNTGIYENLRNRLEIEINRQKHELEKITLENQILEKKAYEDELTGIMNRRSINIYLNETLKNMHSTKDSLLVFLIDIDKFKRYNDYWGHSGGDICLKSIADCIKSIQIEKQDIFGRYGGEEFIYISTKISYEDALELGNLLRIRVEELGLYYMYNGEKKIVTISIGGIIGMSSDFHSMAELMELADKELYRAKEMGRNLTILKQAIEMNK